MKMFHRSMLQIAAGIGVSFIFGNEIAAAAIAPLLFRVTVTNQAGLGYPSAPIYAADSFTTPLLEQGSFHSAISYATPKNSLVGGHANIDVQIAGSGVSVIWDVTHSVGDSGFADVWNPVLAEVRVDIFAPTGDRVAWSLQSESAGGLEFRRNRSYGNEGVDNTIYNTSAIDTAKHTDNPAVIVDGVEYSQLDWPTSYYYNAEGDSLIKNLWNYFGPIQATSLHEDATVNIQASNISVPEPASIVSLVAVGGLLKRRRRDVQ